LKEYLNTIEIREQLAEAFIVPPKAIEVALPKEERDAKKYNGVDWWYWLAGHYSASAAYFCLATHYGDAPYANASSVGGCAPAFHVLGMRLIGGGGG
jgi:hypothetical protein